jgi:hypothetical protein
MSIYITPDKLTETYNEADTHSDEWFKPFNEYERIAGNKLSAALGKNMPRVNDGSLAASLLETPMNVLPVMTMGKFKSGSDKAWIDEIVNIIWRTKIIPNANTQASYFDKEQISLYRALKYGAQPRYNFYVSTEDYTGSDWSLPYIRNVKLEPGKFSVDDCDYIFLDIYYTKLQLERIIDGIKKENKLAKKEGRESDTSWDIKNLQKLADLSLTDKEANEKNINERDRVSSSGIKCTACFNKGKDAPFYMFSKHLPEGELLREWKNPDPTGALPITMQYCYETLESPYGIGRVELAGPTQNVLDYMTQAHVLATQIGLQPPRAVRGAIDQANLNTITHTPDALWILGQANVDVINNTNPVYTQFPSNYGLYKTQLMNLQGRTDSSVSATSGNPEFSKTPAGVKSQEARTNAQDNYLRNKADQASAKMAEKMMNIHMAKMQGADLLQIAEDDRLRLEKAGFFDDNPMTDIPSITEIPILYDDLRFTFKFEFDPRPESNEDEKNRWLELIDIITSNPNVMPALMQSGYNFDLGEAMKKVITASGVDGWDKVLVKLNPEQMVGELGGTPPEAEMTGEMPQEDMIAPDDQSVQNVMAEYGVDQATAQGIVDAYNKGYSEEEIMGFLQGGK